jgi:hypothetical protein
LFLFTFKEIAFRRSPNFSLLTTTLADGFPGDLLFFTLFVNGKPDERLLKTPIRLR